MPKRFNALLALLLTCLTINVAEAAKKAKKKPLNPLKNSKQVIMVITGGWHSKEGMMQRFEFQKKEWKPVGTAVQVVVGKNGLGWGIGLHPANMGIPQKQEGDGKGPAGIFSITEAFSKKSSFQRKSLLKCHLIRPTTEAIDDPNSKHYNKIIDNRKVEKDWESSEMMKPIDLYNLGIVINHNIPVKDKQAGSCIFLHRWRLAPSQLDEGNAVPKGTAGCTGMDLQVLQECFSWVNPTLNPVIVQLPIAQYMKHKEDWRLPSIDTLAIKNALTANHEQALKEQLFRPATPATQQEKPSQAQEGQAEASNPEKADEEVPAIS